MGSTRDAAWRGGRWAAVVAAVSIVAAGGCGGRHSPAEPEGRGLYADPTHGVCQSLPFQIIEQHVGPRFTDFNVRHVAFGATEVIGLDRTMVATCDMVTARTGERAPTGAVRVNLYTHSSTDEAATHVGTLPTGAELPTDADVDAVTWRDRSADMGRSTRLLAVVLDRNLVMTVDVQSDAIPAGDDTLKRAVGTFIAHTVRQLRQGPARPAPRWVPAAPGPTYQPPGAGFCRRLPIAAFRPGLGEPLPGYPDEQLVDAGAFCQTLTKGRRDGDRRYRGAGVRVWIGHHPTAQAAVDFFHAHPPTATGTAPPPGQAELAADELSWGYRSPSEGGDGRYDVRLVTGNLFVYLTVTSYTDNPAPVVDAALAPAVREFLAALLDEIRSAPTR
ncbi:hypothetical protein ACVCAH_21320 [Micromonospora sp. LZ34]